MIIVMDVYKFSLSLILNYYFFFFLSWTLHISHCEYIMGYMQVEVACYFLSFAFPLLKVGILKPCPKPLVAFFVWDRRWCLR
jgi:glucan phosphoethanolaminetransferase (alkaline phosphatase superfamily)